MSQQTLTELADGTGIAMPTALRLLRTLEAVGYVRRAPDGSFFAGPELLRLSLAIDRDGIVGSLVRSTLEDLRNRFDESAAFFVQDQSGLLCVGAMESTQLVRRVYPPAHRVPLHVGAAGKVFLTFGDTEELLGRVRETTAGTFTKATGSSHNVDELQDVIAETRDAGYAKSSQETSLESWGVAAPVFMQSQLLGALCFGVPISRRQPGYEEKLGVACREAAAQLSASLST